MLDAILAVLGATREELEAAESAAIGAWSSPVSLAAAPGPMATAAVADGSSRTLARGAVRVERPAAVSGDALPPLAELVAVWERLGEPDRARLLAVARSLLARSRN